MFAVSLRSLRLLQLRFSLFKVSVDDGEFVLQRGDLLVLLQDRLFVLLVLGLSRLCSLDSSVGFRAKRGDFLSKP